MKHHLPLIFILSIFAKPTLAEERPFWVFLGAEGGFSHLDTDRTNEIDKKGFQFDGKLLGTYYFDLPVLVEGGFGWLFNRVSGSSGIILEEQLTTRSMFFEIGARYRIFDFWQLGIVSMNPFGPDLTFGVPSSTTNLASFLGLNNTFEFHPSPSWAWRATVSALTDVSVSGRQIVWALAGLQIGLPIGGKQVALPQKSFVDIPKASAKPEIQPKAEKPLEEPRVVSKAEVSEAPPAMRVSLAGKSIQFAFGSTDLTPESKNYLLKLGAALKAKEGSWQAVRVEGHTDKTGAEEFNLKLSEERAKAVGRVLLEAGLSSEQVSVVGFGSAKPKVDADSPAAYRENRRVELAFDEVSDADSLKKDLQGL